MRERGKHCGPLEGGQAVGVVSRMDCGHAGSLQPAPGSAGGGNAVGMRSLGWVVLESVNFWRPCSLEALPLGRCMCKISYPSSCNALWRQVSGINMEPKQAAIGSQTLLKCNIMVS